MSYGDGNAPAGVMHCIGHDQATWCGQWTAHQFSWTSDETRVTCRRCLASLRKRDRKFHLKARRHFATASATASTWAQPESFFHYLIVLNDGAPLILLRTPMVLRERRRGGPRFVHALPWKTIVTASIELLKSRGLTRRNLLSLENSSCPDEWHVAVKDPWRSESARAEAHEFVLKLERAFAGDGEILRDFHLYEQRADSSVSLVRGATRS